MCRSSSPVRTVLAVAIVILTGLGATACGTSATKTDPPTHSTNGKYDGAPGDPHPKAPSRSIPPARGPVGGVGSDRGSSGKGQRPARPSNRATPSKPDSDKPAPTATTTTTASPVSRRPKPKTLVELFWNLPISPLRIQVDSGSDGGRDADEAAPDSEGESTSDTPESDGASLISPAPSPRSDLQSTGSTPSEAHDCPDDLSLPIPFKRACANPEGTRPSTEARAEAVTK